MDPEKAFALTIAAFFHPRAAWEETPERGGIAGPLLFAALCAGIGSLFQATWNLAMFQWYMRHRPGLRPPRLPILGRWVIPISKVNLIVSPIVNTALMVFFIFVLAAIIHAGVLLFARRSSTSGFEGSFRVAAYSSACLLGEVIPVIGALIVFVWWLLLAFPGIARMHRISIGRAVAVVLVPFAVIFCVMLLATRQT
jgi:hypothetical protein